MLTTSWYYFYLAILQTYMPVEEMPKFCLMRPERREQRFFKLVKLVLGTRVYNYSLGFGGEGIDNRELRSSVLSNITSFILQKFFFICFKERNFALSATEDPEILTSLSSSSTTHLAALSVEIQLISIGKLSNCFCIYKKRFKLSHFSAWTSWRRLTDNGGNIGQTVEGGRELCCTFYKYALDFWPDICLRFWKVLSLLILYCGWLVIMPYLVMVEVGT